MNYKKIKKSLIINIENENLRTVNESNRINKKYYEKIQELEKELEKNKEYVDANEEDIIEKQKKIKELSNLKDELDEENREIKEKLDNRKKLIDECENELDRLNYKHEKEKQKLLVELNDKGVGYNDPFWDANGRTFAFF